MSFAIRLSQDGLLREEDRDGETRSRVYRPTTLPELLRFWHFQLDGIDEGVTLGDLLSLLRGVDGIGDLAPMFSCAVEEFLDEAAEAPLGDHASDLRYLEVYNIADLVGYDPRAVDSHGMRGRFRPPYRIARAFHGWGPWCSECWGGEPPESAPDEGGIAIEFTPVNALVHLPLRYNPRIAFTSDLYGEIVFETEITIEFGEFVHAILREIGFMGSPGDRNEKRNELERIMEDVEYGAAELIPLDDFLAELGLDSDGIELPEEPEAPE